MRLAELDLPVPEELIAQEPAEPRDSCRLMYLPAAGGWTHHAFSDLPGLLRPGDCLVFNDSRVVPARLFARKVSGGTVELLFVKRLQPPAAEAGELAPTATARPTSGAERELPSWKTGELWEVLARPSHRLRPGSVLLLPRGERLVLESRLGDGRWELRVPGGQHGLSLMRIYGRLPLPPYIKRYPAKASTYQTVYARHPGSAAAPTAGLHFTRPLLQRLSEAGIKQARVTLHVGLDTFQPIREEVVEEHVIHQEEFRVEPHALKSILETRAQGGRIVAVGTTSVRVLETLAQQGRLRTTGTTEPIQGGTGLYITPGYQFQAVNALITNFHLPRSTVLVLTMAFAGVDRLREAYAEAVALGYRFFSFGDAMLIERTDGGAPSEDRAFSTTLASDEKEGNSRVST